MACVRFPGSQDPPSRKNLHLDSTVDPGWGLSCGLDVRGCFVHLEGFKIAASWLGCVFVHRAHFHPNA